MTAKNQGKTPCDDLFRMKQNDTCTEEWNYVREILHPAQEAVGFAAVKRKLEKDYQTRKKAQKRMLLTSLPFVLGPKGVPYLIDSHHTVSALEASGFRDIKVNLKKVCDWSHLTQQEFYNHMKKENFMNPLGRQGNDKPNILPLPIQNLDTSIPEKIMSLKDDPWRSLAALVRKVKDKEECPPENEKCKRGYYRGCEEDDRMTPFFEFRWAYFMNEAYHKGCDDMRTSYWDNVSDCKRFERAFNAAMERNYPENIVGQDSEEWRNVAKLLVPLCRGKKAGLYRLPDSLGHPMGGEPLPGYVSGNTKINKDDPNCKAPVCPDVLKFLNKQQCDSSTNSKNPKQCAS